jgi:hypothetical protein
MPRMSAGLMLVVLLVGFGMGWGITSLWNHFHAGNSVQKPIITASQDNDTINEDSQIIFEREYLRCGHVVISEYSQRENLMGKTLTELHSVFRHHDGYQLSLKENTLVIRQKVEDWCPDHKNMYRLKEYQGRVAIYQGPDSSNDKLLRVTNLPMASLPEDIQEKIRQGSYEFTSEEALNDALENFDEYL